jgi:hypothetical protein
MTSKSINKKRGLDGMKKKYFFSTALLLLNIAVYAQTKPKEFILGTYPSTSTIQYSAKGFQSSSSSSNYGSNNTYTMVYGKIDENTPGYNRIVKTFTVEGYTYSLTKAFPGTQPFKEVIINRIGTNPINKLTALFESVSPPSGTSNTTIYLAPDYVETMEDLINSYVINRGTDNLLNRYTKDATWNNIVRVDMLLQTPVLVPTNKGDREKSGFLLMERGGNDTFKAAAVTGLDGSGKPNKFGSIITVASNKWGKTGHTMKSVVVQKNPTDTELKPSQSIDNQDISGVFLNLEDLSPAVDEIGAPITIYGVSIIDSEATSPTNFPTTGKQNANGLDFMAGGGFFTRAILVKGTVWNDANSDAVNNEGQSSGTNNGGTLWANLVGPDGKVISSIDVKADGTYTLYIAETQRANGEYKIILTNRERFEGEYLSTADPLQNAYQYTGTNFKSQADPKNQNGIINIGSLASQSEDMEDVDFGISMTVTPVTLVDFTLNQEENKVNLQWTTTSETNNAGFEVQFSEDGRNWTTLGFVKASTIDGNSEDRNVYSFLHLNPVFGQNYYRLKQIDHDDTFAYSPIRALKVSISHLLVWPNPSSGHIKVGVSDAQASQIKSMKVVDMSGRILKEAPFYIENWDISDLKSDAFYILRVDYKNNFSEQIRIYKR